MLVHRLRNRHFFLMDTIVLFVSPMLALFLRLDTGFGIAEPFQQPILIYTAVALVLRLCLFYVGGLYRRYWRYASIEEGVRIVTTVGSATLLASVTTVIARWLWNFGLPLSVPFIDGLLVLLAVAGSRFSVRLVEARRPPFPVDGTRRVLVMGAGDAGTMVAKEMQRNPRLGLKPIAFLDDDAEKLGMDIHGLPVLGKHDDIPHLVQSYQIQRVVIAMPTAPGIVIRDIVDLCERVGVEVKTVPGIYELLNGTVNVRQIRDVDIEDLLRREPVQTDTAAVQQLIAGKRVLVTGGGGSIGSELCRQILRGRPAELIMLGHGENSIFTIYHELKQLAGADTVLTPVIADVRFPKRLQHLFKLHRPEIVFHAAAHKHVPLMENNPAEAVSNNILGTKNLLQAANAVGVRRFVMVSTDKAVNPTNVMGASKRVAELLVQQMAIKNKRPYVVVRFGNVLGSRGSVVLTFKQQIARGGPVTVTHPEMQRYFMTIPEAVQLVLQAAVLGTGGETFLLDMGEPVKIMDLARDMIILSGLTVDRDIEIAITGLRPGEKLFEELYANGESHKRTAHEKIFVAAQTRKNVIQQIEQGVAALASTLETDDPEKIRQGLMALVPEYEPHLNEKSESNVRQPTQRLTVSPATATGD